MSAHRLFCAAIATGCRSARQLAPDTRIRNNVIMAHGSQVHPANARSFWALNGLRSRMPGNGGVLYTGHVGLPSGAQLAWQRHANTDALLKLDWADLHEVLAALAHPVRLALLRATLGQSRTTQELMALPNMGTSGQLFHHLKTLQHSGWLRSLQRGTYEVPGERVVPLLAILAAAQG
jgi:hypothetical protein